MYSKKRTHQRTHVFFGLLRSWTWSRSRRHGSRPEFSTTDQFSTFDRGTGVGTTRDVPRARRRRRVVTRARARHGGCARRMARARRARVRSGLHPPHTTHDTGVTPHKTLDSAAQESYTGGNSKDAVQPALSRRSSGRVECIQCTPMSEAPAARKAVHSASACSRDRNSANRSASASKAGLAA